MNGSIRGSSPSPRTSSVTEEPRARQAVAISTPTTPPPTTTRRPGTALALVASRLVQGLASASPGTGGTTARLPVHTATAWRAVSTRSPSTTTRRGPANAAVAADQVDTGRVQPADLSVVLPVGGELVAVGEHRGHVQGHVRGVLEAGDPARLGAGGDRAQQGLAGHARPVGAFAADQFALHEHRAQPCGMRPVGDVLTGRPGSQHDDVIRLISGFGRFGRCHRLSLPGWA